MCGGFIVELPYKRPMRRERSVVPRWPFVSDAGVAFDAGFPLFKALFCEPNPVPIKCAMHHLGVIGAQDVRRPLCEMTPENRSELLSVIETIGRPA